MHAVAEFGVSLSRTTISKLLKRKGRYCGGRETDFSKRVKKLRRCSCPDLDRVLPGWFTRVELKTPISDAVLLEKPKELAKPNIQEYRCLTN